MSKTTNIILLVLAAFFILLGVKSAMHTKAYAQLSNIQIIKGSIYQLHCPPKGAAALSLTDSDFTYNLSIKFRSDYCEGNKSQVLLGKKVILEAIEVNDGFYQVYKLTGNGRDILTPDEVESDQASSTFGLFFLAFLLIALVLYKNRQSSKKTNQA
ncbi:hypothetical protein [Litorilituus lipolyticus]|uniref:Uncharacterized protein n=1 Tax=Litorilituus lipolyticus TaxID=2491017 RepID=A0A502L2J3_9GAMM|nr:hypothetical protein [Litorilituus lipolyticus]TPH18122.1 hypothetical protein EPA86_03130 [Litorilituus lipolyticus]